MTLLGLYICIIMTFLIIHQSETQRDREEGYGYN